MDRFFPPAGFGFGRPFFRPFPHPFFPNRFLFPFFFFSPYFFPFFRDGDPQHLIYAQHQVQPGDTLEGIAHRYNIPHAMLEEANSHLAHPGALSPGETVVIPRISNMYCHKTYAEMTMPAQSQAHHGYGYHM